jgi:hypothetical protein
MNRQRLKPTIWLAARLVRERIRTFGTRRAKNPRRSRTFGTKDAESIELERRGGEEEIASVQRFEIPVDS